MEAIACRDTGRPTPHQLNLLEADPLHLRQHNLFFAALPPIDIARRIFVHANEISQTHQLRKKPFAPTRLHVSIQGLGAYAQWPAQLVDHALHAASRITLRRFEMRFDQIVSFCGRSHFRRDFPLVLLGSKPNDHFLELQRILATALGIRAPSTYTPHLTLLYDEQIVQPQSIQPITWSIEEFVLIHSVLKQPNRPKQPYSILGRWSLR